MAPTDPDYSTPRDIEWEEGIGSSRPVWAAEPDLAEIEHLARTHPKLSAALNGPFTVSFFAEGGFNKLYSIDAQSDADLNNNVHHSYLLRVPLPVDPSWKTLSEVATIQFVRQNATPLVPTIVAYNADLSGSSLGDRSDKRELEWILMERLSGKNLHDQWDSMPWEAKTRLVRDVVGILARLFDHQLSGIGNIFPGNTDSPAVGRIVSMLFFWGKHYQQNVPRGPFQSSHDWLHTRLIFVLNDSDSTLRTSDDEDDIEEAEASKAVAERLLLLLPTIFPPHPTTPQGEPVSECTVITHDDASFHNILVDDRGSLTGIVDWEFVSALPLWRACQLPSFLDAPRRKDKPDPETYAIDEDTGKPNELYFENLKEWEQTQLSLVFEEEMERVKPEWIRTYRASREKMDFDLAVQYCDSELSRGKVKKWVTQMEKRQRGEAVEYTSLRDTLWS